MPFKSKPYIKVGRGAWETYIPKPPQHATHARLTCFNQTYDDGRPKTATLPIQDFGCFKGVSGDFSFIRMDNKRKVHEEYEGTWYWDGIKVPEVELMRKDEH